MAKGFNWEKLRKQSLQQSINERNALDFKMNFDDNRLWSLKGKYYGTHLSKLPNDYLFWVIDNFEGKYKGIAEGEVYRRYNELSNT